MQMFLQLRLTPSTRLVMHHTGRKKTAAYAI